VSCSRSNPLATNREQYSALHLASMYSKEETVKVILLGVIIATSISSLFVFLFSVWQAEALLRWEMEKVPATSKSRVFFYFSFSLIQTYYSTVFINPNLHTWFSGSCFKCDTLLSVSCELVLNLALALS
jgi:hypothetical protein